MTARANPNYYVTLPTTAFDADEPVSTLRSWYVRNNAQHLIDVAPQYLVNWAADTSSGAADGISFIATADSPTYVAWEFPIIMIREDTLPWFDIRVAGHHDGGTGTGKSIDVTAALAPIGSAPEYTGAANDAQFFRTTDSADSGTATWIIDNQWAQSAPDRSYLESIRTFSVTENSVQLPVKVVMARLEVTVSGTDLAASDVAYLEGVQLRAFV